MRPSNAKVTETARRGDINVLDNSQYANITIVNKNAKELTVKNVILDWGKFQRCGMYGVTLLSYVFGSHTNPPMCTGSSVEIPVKQVEGLRIPATMGEVQICARGRDSSSAGCTGSFDIFTTATNVRVCSVYFDSPHIGANVFSTPFVNSFFSVSATGANTGSGALGSVTLTIN